MTPGRLIAAALAGAVLVAVHAWPADAQGPGGGRGPGMGRRPPPPRGEREPPPAPVEESPPGRYPFEFDKILEVVNRGEGRQALAWYEETVAEAVQQGDRLRAARASFGVAVVALRVGLFQKAIQAGQKAVEIFKASDTLGPADAGRWSSTYIQLGAAYRHVGDLAQARKTLEEALTFAESHFRGRREMVNVGMILIALARVANAQQDYQAARERATQAAEFFEKAAANMPPSAPERARTAIRRHAATALAEMGRAELGLGRRDEAEAAFDRALKFARLVGLREAELEIVQAQATLAVARQDWAKAEALYRQGLALAGEIKQPGALMWLNQGLARALKELGRPDEAFPAAREAVRHVEEVRAELGESGLRSQFLEDKQRIYQLAIRLALDIKKPDEAFALVERSRARAFLDILGNQTTVSKGRTRALVEEEVRLRARLGEARATVQESDDDAESAKARARVDALDRDYRAFLDRVRKENVEQASLMTVEPVTLSEIQALLPEGTTLLEYLVGDNDVVVWAIDRHGVKVAKIDGDRPSLVGMVRGLRAAIASQASLDDVQRRAAGLHARLLGALRRELGGGRRLLIVPHGVLHYLPFAALRSPGGRWLVDDFAIATLPSASVLRYLTDKGVNTSGRTLAVGNPDVGAGLALRWAEREARMVGQREPGATVLVRADATEAQVKKLAEGAGLLHFATHGELSETDPLSSALLLVPGGGEDGRLEVRELFGLDLHARLVVLSACQTGLGKISSGDEIVGLQRAFLYAGTPAVVTTLWKVDDRASYELIRAFYDRLAQAGAMEALRQAQIETMRAFPHPYAWAAFGLTGAPR
ncbi:MAG: CHAT domain-containing protein [Candidatus Rokubacteria bacterium]|nr:CHAT domain-containing protein [Candidatus Rokubacteria bacterium]